MSASLLPAAIRVFVRGWLHGNVIAIDGDPPALVDAGYATGADDTIAWFEQATGRPITSLETLHLTHVHSDHAGGAAALRAAAGCAIAASPGCQALTDPWDRRGLWLEGTGQVLPRFTVDQVIRAGDVVRAGGFTWRVVDLPGHATGGVGFFEESRRVVITGDALWEDGIGILKPDVDGPEVFDEALAALDAIAALEAAVVIPGHGRPFADVGGALERARRRVLRWRSDPEAHRRSQAGSLAAFWLLANPGAPREDFDGMLVRGGVRDVDALVAGLRGAGILAEDAGRVYPGRRVRAPAAVTPARE